MWLIPETPQFLPKYCFEQNHTIPICTASFTQPWPTCLSLQRWHQWGPCSPLSFCIIRRVISSSQRNLITIGTSAQPCRDGGGDVLSSEPQTCYNLCASLYPPPPHFKWSMCPKSANEPALRTPIQLCTDMIYTVTRWSHFLKQLHQLVWDKYYKGKIMDIVDLVKCKEQFLWSYSLPVVVLPLLHPSFHSLC